MLRLEEEEEKGKESNINIRNNRITVKKQTQN